MRIKRTGMGNEGTGNEEARPAVKGICLPVIVGILFAFLSWIYTDQTRADAEWKQATAGREWCFPRDHGSHPAFRTEWWYFTGNLTDDNQLRYGYQLTFFRQGIVPRAGLPLNSWSVRDLYFAHFTLTDIKGKRFFVAEKTSRTGPSLAGAGTPGLDVWLLNWSAKAKGDAIVLSANAEGRNIHLELRPRKPVVLNGTNGLSQKGPAVGQASYYASLTHLATSGTIKTPGMDGPVRVRGISWFDHEFGSNQLSFQQVGWDWFGLHLSDGRDLMLYILRRHDGSVDAASGTLVEPDGLTRQVEARDFVITVTKRWKSPQSGGDYPAGWKIRLPGYGISFHTESLLEDQELITKGSTGVTYWEGVVAGKGQSNGRAVTCEGYVELTGYSGSLKGLF